MLIRKKIVLLFLILDWKYTPLIEENGCKMQTLTYTVPLNYSIGPKQSLTESKQVALLLLFLFVFL